MITVLMNEPNDYSITGEMAVGDVVQGYCCARFSWEVVLIQDTAWASIWGGCANPNCPKYQANIGPSDMFRGISSVSVDALAEWMIEQPEEPVEDDDSDKEEGGTGGYEDHAETADEAEEVLK